MLTTLEEEKKEEKRAIASSTILELPRVPYKSTLFNRENTFGLIHILLSVNTVLEYGIYQLENAACLFAVSVAVLL